MYTMYHCIIYMFIIYYICMYVYIYISITKYGKTITNYLLL